MDGVTGTFGRAQARFAQLPFDPWPDKRLHFGRVCLGELATLRVTSIIDEDSHHQATHTQAEHCFGVQIPIGNRLGLPVDLRAVEIVRQLVRGGA